VSISCIENGYKHVFCSERETLLNGVIIMDLVFEVLLQNAFATGFSITLIDVDLSYTKTV
jgi:hypothetical protein